MDLIFPFVLENPNFLEYIFPLNVIGGASLLLGVLFQVFLLKKKWRWYLLPLVLLAISIACECLYQMIGTFDAFLFVFVGVPTDLALSGTLIGSLIHVIWTKVRHS